MQESVLDILKSTTAIIAEDDKIIRENVSQSLGFFCKNILEAKDGKEALNIYNQKSPEILFTDIKMPNLSGLDLIEKIREKDDGIFIVIISAHSEIDLLRRAIRSQPEEYIIKPFSQNEFIETLERIANKIKKKESQKIKLSNGVQFIVANSELKTEDKTTQLSPKEATLLNLLLRYKNYLVSYEQIWEVVWQGESYSEDALRSVILSLRKKVGKEVIKNISKTGYKIEL